MQKYVVLTDHLNAGKLTLRNNQMRTQLMNIAIRINRYSIGNKFNLKRGIQACWIMVVQCDCATIIL